MPLLNFTAADARAIGRGVVEYFKATFDGDSSYPSGGYDGVLAALILATDREVTIQHMDVEDGDGYTLAYLTATDKLKLYWTGSADGREVEVPNNTDVTDLSAIVIFRVR